MFSLLYIIVNIWNDVPYCISVPLSSLCYVLLCSDLSFFHLCFSSHYTVWGLWISVSCLSAQSAAETCHPLLTHINVQPRQDDETSGNVLFTIAPQLSQNGIPSMVGRAKSKHGKAKHILHVKDSVNSKWEMRKYIKQKMFMQFLKIISAYWCNHQYLLQMYLWQLNELCLKECSSSDVNWTNICTRAYYFHGSSHRKATLLFPSNGDDGIFIVMSLPWIGLYYFMSTVLTLEFGP